MSHFGRGEYFSTQESLILPPDVVGSFTAALTALAFAADITVSDGTVRFRKDGTTATVADGNRLSPGEVLHLDTLTDITNFSVITEGGVTTTLTATFFRRGALDETVAGRFVTSRVITLDDTGTPTVAGGNLFLTGGTTAITDFDDGVVGQVIEVLSAHTITITDGASLDLAAGANYSMTATDTLILQMFNDQVWVEMGRSVNGG